MKNNNEKVLQQEEKIQENVRKVDLSGLPRNYRGIDWEKSIGQEVSFVYNEISGIIEIVRYIKEKQTVVLKYNGKIKEMRTDRFQKALISSMLGIAPVRDMNKPSRYKIGDVVEISNTTVEIVSVSKGKYTSKYEWKCTKDGHVGKLSETEIHEKLKGCPVCSNKKVIKDINSVYATNPELVQYFVNEEDSYVNTIGSKTKVLVRCPICGHEKEMAIHKLSTRGMSCDKCGDGISYPNKFVFNVLEQIGIEFEVEKTFCWLQDRKYDVYIPQYNMIIENHGRQHYDKTFEYTGKSRTIEEEIENDVYKRNTALQNGIETYIELDCRFSDDEFIMESIVNSGILEILGVKSCEIDWKKCHKYACSSLVYEVCELWNKGLKNSSEISKVMKISNSTSYLYLKKGAKLGLCDYDSNKVKQECLAKGRETNIRVEVFKDGVSQGIFESIRDLCRKSKNMFGVKFEAKCISNVCKGKAKHHHGFKFEVVKESA